VACYDDSVWLAFSSSFFVSTNKKGFMGYLKMWIHLVWATKNREPMLAKAVRDILFPHMKENARDKNIYVDCINGYTDHVHVLISLKPTQTIAGLAQLLKGESSYWINKNNLLARKFEWQDDYFGVSVSPNELDRVRDYIKYQEVHHHKKTFQEEYDEFIEKYESVLVSG
jgi:REP element-mobilizing transposase RayT